jgi:penicillin V acylase-like amidase (Ntn superfamily)
MKAQERRAITGRMRSGVGAAALTAILGSIATPTNACTDFILPKPSAGEDRDGNGELLNSVVSSRTMDFNVNLAWFMETQNDQVAVASPDPDRKNGKLGLGWTTKYKMVGFRGAEQYSKPGRYFDGMNTEGLSAAMLWLDRAWRWNSDTTNYPLPVVGNHNLSVQYVVNFLVSQCQDVACAIGLLRDSERMPVIWGEKLTIYEDPDIGLKLQAPLALHLVLHDATNNTAVVEWYGREQHILWDSGGPADKLPQRIQVLTNDPVFEKQVDNLFRDEFAKLKRRNHFKLPMGNQTKPGQNFLPGDSSSGSRFIRSYKLKQALAGKMPMGWAPPETLPVGEYYWAGYPEDDDDPFKPKLWRVQLANRVMARVEEVWGEYPEDFLIAETFFYTNFTLIRDHTNKNIYLRGVYNSNLRRVSLDALFKANPPNYSKQYVDPNPNKNMGYELPQYQDVNPYFTRDLPRP